MRLMRKFFALLTLCLLLGVCLPTSAGAAENGSLTLKCEYDGAPLAGADFALYRIGAVAEDGSLQLQNAFAAYPVLPDHAAFAQTLHAYACKDQLAPDHTLQTNEQGFSQISGLSEGVYLLAGRQFAEAETIYEFQAQLVYLPYGESMGVVMQAKCAARESSESPISLKVQKVWEDGGNPQLRMDSVTVYLLKDGTLWDTVTLSKANSWRYTWKDLDPNAQWQVAEEPVMDYFVTVSREGDTFTVVNTYDSPIPDPPVDPPDIPQTGMLLWPIPLLAAAGIALVILGIVLCRRGRQ